MSDYINRAVVMERTVKRNSIWNKVTNASGQGLEEIINEIPSADVAPVRHGHWIEYGENKDGTHNICCSVCDGFIKSKGHANSCYTRNKYRYCHNCGARMDGESNG